MHARCHLYSDRQVARSTATVENAIAALDRFKVTTNGDGEIHFCPTCRRETTWRVNIHWKDPRT